ncbi:MAG: geranylgeranylglycerol-phosphate geranylgeranyltransferase, partial [Bacteroidales bacterium]|nr:geranylgeranylglycerol-phosphate geranylgeranyltransferase [Bacteroidales bacterium]
MTFTISPYFKLLRVPNLIIIILTQYLIRFCVIKPVLQFHGVNLTFSELDFALLVFSTILIAVAGYIINDYFDIQIDAYNKPDKLIVGKKVSIGTAKLIYAILNGIAFIIGFYLAIKVNAFQLGFIFVMIAIMLWYYSAKYKRQIFWGNLVVAILSALVLLIVWIFEFFSLRLSPIDFIDAYRSIKIINIIIWSYSLFAFMVTLIREMIKDIQDIEGDSKFGCRTLAVVFGIRATKYITTSLIIICIL